MRLPLLLLVLCALSLQQQQLTNVSLTLLNQTQASSGRVLCQRMPDRQGSPLLLAADDLVLSSSLWASAVSCDTLVLSFATLRQRYDRDPSNITVQLMRSVNNTPATVFFQRTWDSPLNNINWSVYTVTPQWSTVALRQNDWDDAGTTRFDLQNASFLPRDTVFWVAMYVTMSVKQTSTAQNAFFWLSLDPVAASDSPNFFYRDASNLQHWGFTNWTDGAVAAPFLNLPAGTKQMAWWAWLQCLAVVTESPTAAPTLAPTNAPTNATVAPTPATNETGNFTGPHSSVASLVAGIGTPLVLAILMSGVCVAVLVTRKRLRTQRPSEPREDVPSIDIRAAVAYVDEHSPRPPRTVDFDAFVNNPLMRSAYDEPARIFTSGREMTDVPLMSGQTTTHFIAIHTENSTTASDTESSI